MGKQEHEAAKCDALTQHEDILALLRNIIDEVNNAYDHGMAFHELKLVKNELVSVMSSLIGPAQQFIKGVELCKKAVRGNAVPSLAEHPHRPGSSSSTEPRPVKAIGDHVLEILIV